MKKHLYKLLLINSLLLVSGMLHAQILKNVNLNLNAGARVYDVEYIEPMNAYAVVGDFTSINGVSRDKVALLDATTFAVKSNYPFNNSLTFDGVVRSVEYQKVGTTNYLVFGGRFFSVNASAIRQGLLLFTATGTINSSSSFNMFNWDYALSSGAGGGQYGYIGGGMGLYGIYDMKFFGDTLLIGGNIGGIDLSSGTDNELVGDYTNSCFIGLRATPSTASKFTIMQNSITYPIVQNNSNYKCVYSIEKAENSYFITGGNSPYPTSVNYYFYQKRNPDLTIDNTFAPTTYSSPKYGSSIANFNDSILVYMEYSGGAGGEYMRFNKASGLSGYYGNGSSYGFSSTSPLFHSSSTNNSLDILGHAGYNGQLYTLITDSDNSSYPVNSYYLKRYGIETDPQAAGYLEATLQGTPLSISMSNPTALSEKMDTLNNLFIKNNMLFLSHRNFTGSGSTSRTGFAVFCLEPENPKDFTVYDTLVCTGDQATYTIPDSKGAAGYKWLYTGTGAQYRTSPTASWTNYTAPFMTTAASAEFRFPAGSTSGSVGVIPYSVCNTTTDYQFADTAFIPVTVVLPPNIQVADTLAFTCLTDSLNLVVSSAENGASFQWYFNQQAYLTDTLVVADAQYNLGTYFATVTEPVNGCTATDSVQVIENKVYPSMAYTYSNPVWNCYSDSIVITAADTNAFAPETAVIHSFDGAAFNGSNPLVMDSLMPVIFRSEYPGNGCVHTDTLNISTDFSLLGANVHKLTLAGASYSGNLNCTNDSLLLTLTNSSSTVPGNFFWISDGDTIQDSILLTPNDQAYFDADTIAGVQTVNVIYYYYTFNQQSGCYSPLYPAFVTYDLQKPYLTPYSGNQMLTCSDTLLELVHVPNPLAAENGWLASGQNSLSDTLYADQAGTYYYEVKGSNGCTSYDTVSVAQTNELVFAPQSGLLVCPGEVFSLTAQAISTDPVTYSWQPSDQGTGGIDTVFIVTAVTPQGCTGTDTLYAFITSPVQALFTAYAACGQGGYIQVDTIWGGAVANNSQYLYAFNGSSATSVNNFPVDSIGAYPISISDTLGCSYDFTTLIGGQVNTPEMNFLVSTYNETGDTLILVDISDFHGFDGVDWIFPAGIDVVYTTDSTAIVTAADSGWYTIQFTGFLIDSISNPGQFDTCYYSFEKPVYFGDFNVNFGNAYLNTGILSSNLYPNPVLLSEGGAFTFVFELGAAQEYTCFVTDNLGQLITGMSASGNGETHVELTMIFPVSTAQGNYILHLVTENDAKQILIAVQ